MGNIEKVFECLLTTLVTAGLNATGNLVGLSTEVLSFFLEILIPQLDTGLACGWEMSDQSSQATK